LAKLNFRAIINHPYYEELKEKLLPHNSEDCFEPVTEEEYAMVMTQQEKLKPLFEEE